MLPFVCQSAVAFDAAVDTDAGALRFPLRCRQQQQHQQHQHSHNNINNAVDTGALRFPLRVRLQSQSLRSLGVRSEWYYPPRADKPRTNIRHGLTNLQQLDNR